MSIADIRKEYKKESLSESDVKPDPYQQFDIWWDEAMKAEIEEVNAMTLATVSEQNIPSARIVLLKGYDQRGFVFFSNYLSRKGKEIESNPNAAILIFWKELERQVRIEGVCEKVSGEESDAYFISRPEGSKIGAWASPQSQVINSREELAEKITSIRSKFQSDQIPRPPHWGGYRVVPHHIEFWQGRPSRLHDRIRYRKEKNVWVVERLAP